MTNLPPDAALWRAIQTEPQTPQEKFGDRLVSIDQFLAQNKSAVRK